MADKKITSYDPIDVFDLGDKIITVDISDTTHGAQGTTKVGTIEQLMELNQIAANPAVENWYRDINVLIANQAFQTANYLQYVGNASLDPAVTSGAAYYEYLGTTNADLTDYRLLSSTEVSVVTDTQVFNRFTVDDITDTAPTDVDPLKVKIHYDSGDDSVIGVLFPAVFSLYLAGMNTIDTALADFSFSLYNKTQNKWFGGVACDFNLVNTVFYKVDFGSSTVDRTDFAVNDIVEVYFNAYKVSSGSVDGGTP